MNRQIFISYRRTDAAGITGRIYDRLVGHFSSDEVFMDVDTIAPGDDFVEVIESAVAKCDVLLAVIGKQWMNNLNTNKSILDDPRDFVRIEIAAALQRRIRVIPVLVEDTPPPNADHLPEELKLLSRKHALEINHSSFNRDIERLISSLNKLFSNAVSEVREGADRESPTGSFYSPRGIERIVSESVHGNESINAHLLIFKTGMQHTWLVATNRQLFCLLDDDETRAENKLIMWQMFLTDIGKIRATRYKQDRGLLDIGKRKNWLYSTALFPQPKALEEAIRKLINTQ